MDKTALLKQRKEELFGKTAEIRKFVNGITDEKSFIETDMFSLGKGDKFKADIGGDGVLTGSAAIDGIPVCVFAQNYAVNKGGLTKSQADKIVKLFNLAEKTHSAVIAVIDSEGAAIGEGVGVMEGYSAVISKINSLCGAVPLIAVIKGKSLGGASYIAALCDFVIMMDGSIAATNSPAVIAANNSNTISAKELCGASAHYTKTGLASLIAKDTADLSNQLKNLLNILISREDFNPETDFNLTAEALNKAYSAEEVKNSVFDGGSFIEIYGGYAPEISCGLAKLGGVTVGALICADNKEGIYLNSKNAGKAEKFLRLLDRFDIPLITFVNAAGVVASPEDESGALIEDIAMLMSAVGDLETPKISVICGRAIGAAYCALASKAMGFDYGIAWPNAIISPLNEAAAAVAVYSGQISEADNPQEVRESLIKKYADIEADPFNAAKEACVDIIDMPALTRGHLIAALMMLW